MRDNTLGDMNLNYAENNPSFKQAEKEQLVANFYEHNRQTLNNIFAEILDVCEQLKTTFNRQSRAILENRYRYLSNKYAYASPDELTTYE